MGGSSLGGLISLYLGFAHPEVFGKVAVMSPSLWWDNRSILNAINQQTTKPEIKIWLDMGTAEGLRHLRDADMLDRLLLKRGWRSGVDLNYEQGARVRFTMRRRGRHGLAMCCVFYFLQNERLFAGFHCEKPHFTPYLDVGITVSVLRLNEA